MPRICYECHKFSNKNEYFALIGRYEQLKIKIMYQNETYINGNILKQYVLKRITMESGKKLLYHAPPENGQRIVIIPTKCCKCRIAVLCFFTDLVCRKRIVTEKWMAQDCLGSLSKKRSLIKT